VTAFKTFFACGFRNENEYVSRKITPVSLLKWRFSWAVKINYVDNSVYIKRIMYIIIFTYFIFIFCSKIIFKFK